MQRRVQICLGLLRPYQILLCDEITVDLDVVARVDRLDFFRAETEQVRCRAAAAAKRCCD